MENVGLAPIVTQLIQLLVFTSRRFFLCSYFCKYDRRYTEYGVPRQLTNSSRLNSSLHPTGTTPWRVALPRRCVVDARMVEAS